MQRSMSGEPLRPLQSQPRLKANLGTGRGRSPLDLWEEIVQFGSIEIALDYVDNVDISREKSLGGLIKLLRRVVIEHLIIITPFI